MVVAQAFRATTVAPQRCGPALGSLHVVAGAGQRCRRRPGRPQPHTFACRAPDCSVTMPRTAQRGAPLRLSSSRPAQLQSSFLAPVAGLKGLCASFARE